MAKIHSFVKFKTMFGIRLFFIFITTDTLSLNVNKMVRWGLCHWAERSSNQWQWLTVQASSRAKCNKHSKIYKGPKLTSVIAFFFWGLKEEPFDVWGKKNTHLILVRENLKLKCSVWGNFTATEAWGRALNVKAKNFTIHLKPDAEIVMQPIKAGPCKRQWPENYKGLAYI